MVQRKVIVRGATNQALDELDAADIPDLSAAYEAAGGIATHAADTTSVHGITDSTVLATDAEVATAVGDHSADTTAVHGLADTSVLATDTEVATAVSDHSADTTAVHGIADMSVLATDTEVATAVSDHAGAANPHPTYETAAEVLAQIGTHEGLANPHPGYLTPAEGDAAYDALGAAAAAAAASQPLDSDLTAIAALTTTAFGRSFLDRADAAAARTILALGTAALAATGDFDAAGAAAAAQAASQPLDSDLTALAALTTTAYGRALLELADAAAGRTALGLGALAQLASLAHSATTGITADDHHAQAHAAAHLPTGVDAVDKFSQAGIGTADLAIANTETVVVSKVFAANELTAGMTFMFKAYATRAGTTSASPIIRIRIGTTTLTGNIASTLTPPVNTLAVGNSIEGMVTIRSAGAGGTALGSLMHTVHLAAVTITESLGVSTATVAVNTTSANQRVELTFISGNAANTYTWRNAVIYRVA